MDAEETDTEKNSALWAEKGIQVRRLAAAGRADGYLWAWRRRRPPPPSLHPRPAWPDIPSPSLPRKPHCA